MSAENPMFRATPAGSVEPLSVIPPPSRPDAASLALPDSWARHCFDYATVGLAISTPTGFVVKVNRALAAMLGTTSDELCGVYFSTIAHPDDIGSTANVLRSLLAGETTSARYAKRYLHKAGHGVWVDVSVVLMRDDAGAPLYFITSVEESTDRRRAEEALRSSEYFFKESQRAAFIGSYRQDLTTGLWESSEVLDHIFGIDAHYVRSVEGWVDIVHPDDQAAMARYFADEVCAKRQRFDREYRIIRKSDGETRWVHGRGELTVDHNGNLASMIGTIQDITERKQAELELRQAHKMKSVGRLAGGVAHDFNNMLSAILGHTELALEQVLPSSPLYDDLIEIRRAAERSAALTRQLLAFARKQTVAPRVVGLNETVEGMLRMLKPLLGEHIELAWRPEPNLWPTRIDPSQLNQILVNLCVNARDAIDQRGTITLETKNITVDAPTSTAEGTILNPGHYVQLTVCDDGSGVDQETLSHMFEPFFTTKGVGKGTGLGLATVYGAVRQNGGVINVTSEPGRGTAFMIYLPRQSGTIPAPRSPSMIPTVLRGKETILLVEDEPSVMTLTAKLLGRMGYTVLAAATPGEAICLAEQHGGRIDLLMTDVVMPEMNGLELANQLLAQYPHLKPLFVSGYTAEVIANCGVLDEKVRFLHKPFSSQALAVKLREVLDG